MPKKGAVNGPGSGAKAAPGPPSGPAGSPGGASGAAQPEGGEEERAAAAAVPPPPSAGKRGGGRLEALALGLLLGAAACAGATRALDVQQLAAALAALGAELPRPPAASCPACKQCRACPECPAPKCPAKECPAVECPALECPANTSEEVLREGEVAAATAACEAQAAEARGQLEEVQKEVKACKQELAKLQVQLEDQSARLPEARAAWAAEREELLRKCSKSLDQAVADATAKASEAAAAASSGAQPLAAANAGAPVDTSAWPACMERDVVLRGRGVYSSFEDVSAVLGEAARGCWAGDCTRTDKLEAGSAEDCARVCAAVPRCDFWTFGVQDSASQCFLRISDAGRETAAGFVAAPRACQPPPTQVSASQAALAVLESAALRACDGGAISGACPDLHDAMRTWNYGIQHLKVSLQGTTNNVGQFLEQISTDADAFLGLPPSHEQLSELYAISAANNRQVFEAVRSWLAGQGQEATFLPGALDASVPRPARGLLCRGECAR